MKKALGWDDDRSLNAAVENFRVMGKEDLERERDRIDILSHMINAMSGSYETKKKKG